jgi:hypothetical protein
MVSSYGKEMKAIVDRNFITTLLAKLKAFKVKKYEGDIAAYEQVIHQLTSLDDYPKSI